MKTTRFFGIGLLFLFLGGFALRADGPNQQMPKWLSDYYVAAGLYQSGASRVSSDPAEAVDYLTKAQGFAQKSTAEGGGTWAIPLSQLIGRALLDAKNNLKNAPQTKPVVSKPPPRPKSIPINGKNNNFSVIKSRI